MLHIYNLAPGGDDEARIGDRRDRAESPPTPRPGAVGERGESQLTGPES